MKIGYLLQVDEEIRLPPYNGPANHVRQVVLELLRRGNQVAVLYRQMGHLWVTHDLQDFREIKVNGIDAGPLRWIEKVVRRIQFELHLPYLGFFESLRFALACRQELRDCDFYLERFSWMTYGGALASRWLGIPLVLEYNGDPLADLKAKGSAPEGVQLKLSKGIMSRSLHRADSIIATGEGWQKNCVEQWDVPAENVVIIENGSELVRILKRDDLRAFREVGAPDPVTHLVYLGGFYPWHGIANLLCALDRAIRRGADLELTLIGSGPGWDVARQLTDDLGLSACVTFTGQLEASQYAPYLAAANIGLSPYCGWQEFSGLKLFDYKAAGLACVASGLNGNPVTIKQGRTGWIVPPCDDDMLCEALLFLSSQPELLREMGQAARLEAEEVHGWDHTVSQLEQIFTQVVNRKAAK